jgi:flagellin
MRINHNISAQLANVNLKKSDSKLSASLERLSSGYKINKAADDSAGMAITNKMRAQIRSLDQASRNSEDGQSIIETAEGAMGEIESILQRIRELAVQTANDTYTLDDRDAIQKEVDELLDEVDRISSTTEFNGTPLLDGSAARTFASSNVGIKAISTSLDVEKGDYTLTVDALATSATMEIDLPQAPGTVYLNGTEISFSADDDDASIAETLQDICDKMNIDIEVQGSSATLTTRATGSQQRIIYKGQDGDEETVYGTKAEVTLGDGFSDTATWSGDGNLITVRDNDGFEMQVEALDAGETTLRVFDAGYMTIQIGANEHQTLNMNFPKVDCENLGLRSAAGTDTINLCTQYGAGLAIDVMDAAIKEVSAARSTLGSYENRLETTSSSLTLSSQDITEAMSRISDTDMADEMTQYTQQDVLSQAATSMLAQANNRPQTIMSLLQ